MNIRYRTSAVCFLALLTSLPGFADPASPRSNAPVEAQSKPYMLFMGTDLSLEWEGKQCPIKGVSENDFVIDVNGRRVTVSSDLKELKFQGKQTLKVAPTGIEISKFEIDRAYTTANDPKRIAANNAAGLSAKQESERYQADNQIAQISSVSAATPSAFGPDPKQNLPATLKDYSNTQASLLNDENLATQGFTTANEARSLHDAFRLSFDIASPTPVAGIYLLLVLHGRDLADKASPDRTWILGQKIGDIGPNAKSVRLFRGGFPPGYVLLGAQVHLYNDRSELGSSVAPKHMEITTDEAFQFSVAEYVSQHRGADTPPVEASTGQAAKVGARLNADQLGRTYYVKVDKGGLPGDAFLDEACTQKIADSFLVSALSSLRFYPALKAGKPVESVAPVQL